tara:strand:+ start:29 stop:961 length:933 start_codon:yes stop_codon:yes gene_type:complete
MNLINIIDKIPGPFDIIINNFSLIHINNIIISCKSIYNIKIYILNNCFFLNQYKIINNVSLYNHLFNNNLILKLLFNHLDNKNLNLILYKSKSISIQFYPNNIHNLTDNLINKNIKFIYDSKINNITGYKHFKYTNAMLYIENIILEKYNYKKNLILSKIMYKTFKHTDIIFNNIFIIVYYSYLLLYHIYNKNYKNIKFFYLKFHKNFNKIELNIQKDILLYILQSFKDKTDYLNELLLINKIDINTNLFYKITLLYIYMIIQQNFIKNYHIYVDPSNIEYNKILLIEKISFLNIPKYLKHIIINKINII